MKWKLLALAVCLAAVSVARAAPPDFKQVAANAQWVVHADVDAMRDSIVVKNAYRAFEEKCPVGKIAIAILDKSRDFIGMDPRKDLHGITAYGSKVGKEEGVLIVSAEVNQQLLLEKVKKAPDYKSSTCGDYTLHSWTHRDKRGKKPVTGTFYKPNVLVFSGSPDEVKAALDVLDGKAKSLDGAKTPLAASVPAGTTILIRVIGINKAELPCNPPVAKSIEMICVAMGENGGTSFLHGKVVMASKESAQQVGDVLNGLRALGLLHAGDDPKEKELAKAAKVVVDGSTAAVDFEAPAQAVWEHIQKDVKRAIERHKRMKSHGGKPCAEKK